jgi:cobaltochelatase CobN
VTSFDPLDCAMAAPWAGPKPDALRAVSDDPWRSNGDTVERIELLAIELVRDEAGAASLGCDAAVLDEIEDRIRPSVEGLRQGGNRRADDGA